MASPIEVAEEIEGESVVSVDYFFERIGESVPIKAHPFDYAQNLPSQPLAVSDVYGGLFLALPDSGFCVARTKDVVALATSSSSSSGSVQQSSVAEVPVGKVHVLALSFDQSTLAATVGEQIHFFSVPSLLLSKGLEPSYTDSADDSSFIKDVQWRKKRSRNSYLVLSDSGELFRGALDSPMEHVMDDVHAVDWSVEGNQIALAKNDTLAIVSSKFKERWSMLLPFESWVGDSVPRCSVKVDSIKWIRSDSIVVGCFQLTEDGNEENYLVQVIRSSTGNISDVSSSCRPIVTNFYDLFAGVVDDILPFGSGPYLLMNYLDQLDIAITSNKKNTDQHITYLGWSLGEEENTVVSIDIGRDKWLPRIELQENDDDNSILALCIDKKSCFGKLKVQLGVEEQSELSPCYVLICLTLEGKLTIFNMACVKATAVSSPDASVVSEEEDDATESVPMGREVIQSSIVLKNKQQFSLGLELQDRGNEKVEEEGNNEVSTDKGLDLIDINKSRVTLSFPTEFSDKQISKHSTEASIISHSFEAGGKQNVRIEPVQPFGGGSSNLGQTLNKSSFSQENRHLVKETFTGFGFGNAPASSAHSSGPIFNVAMEQVSPVNAGFSSFSSNSSKLSFGNSVSSKNTNVKLPLLSSYTQGDGSENASLNATKFGAKVVVSSSPQISANKEHDPLPVPVYIESIPSMRGSYISSPEIGAAGSSMQQRHYPSKENHRKLPQSGILNSEPVLSKHFGNIEDMTKELDMLLRSIEQPGGFRDVCTLSQKSSVEALEQGIQSLSNRYRKCMGIVDERLIDVQNLLDETVRVLARKIYMQGIVKQASDNQYLDLWNRQKLSPDLELKRRHILKLNEILTNQLIELERHFNSIELNKFGESGGIFADKRRTQSRYGSSRQIQSFHSIHNSMNSQLAAAEKLSECLSSQMSMLKVDSPSSKRKNVKQELFETIGIPYDASFSSPSVSKAGDKSFSEGKFLLSGGSTVAKEKSKGKSSVSKVFERETARRRRDSLDQSWASYEPPKTTVKRLLLQESQKPSLHADKQILSSHLLERSKGAQPYSTEASTLSLFGTKGEPAKEISGNQASPFFTDNQMSDKFSGFKSSTVQRKQLSSLASAEGQRLRMGTTTSNTSFDSGLKETKSFLQYGTNIQQSPPFSTKETVPWSSPADSTKIKPSATTPFSGFGRKLESSISLPFGASNAGMSKVQLDEKVSAFPAFSLSSASPSLQSTPGRSSETLSSTTPKSQLFTSSYATAEEKNLTKTSLSFFPSTVASPDALSFQNRKQVTLPSFSSPSPNSTLESPKKEMQASGKANDESDVEPKPLASTSPSIRLSSPSKSDSGSTTPSKGGFDLGTIIQPSKSDLGTSTQVTMISTPSQGEFDLGSIQPSKSETGVTIQPSKSDIGVTIQPSKSETDVTIQPSKSDTSVTIQASTTPPTPSFDSGTTIQPSKSVTIQASTTPLFDFSTTTQLSKSDLGVSTTLPNTSKGAFDFGDTLPKFPTFSSASAPSSDTASKSTFNQPSFAPSLFQTQVATSTSVAGTKTENPIVSSTNDDDMDEEAPESSPPANELKLGNLGGFGLGSVPNPNAPKVNPFGGSFGNPTTNVTPPPFTMNVPSGELFRPASFSFQSPQPVNAFSGGFGTGTVMQAPAPSGGFGQPSQIGQGQQALGSVLGSFGQSRQLGSSPIGGGFGGLSPPGGSLASAAPVGGGFGGFGGLSASSSGFGSLASGSGGFGGAASTGGGFGGAASGGGGFGGAASGGGGGFAAAASGGGFGAFSGQGGGTGGFSTFGSNSAATGKPPELFTQMRK